jgi:uncharacterized protein (DUF1697 family)
MISYTRGLVAQHIILLRGINVGSRNRIAMPALRHALEDAGFRDVRSYLQSGNVVVGSSAQPEAVARKVQALIQRELGLEISLVTRTRADIARVIALDPLHKVATDPKRYQVSFLDAKPPSELVRRLEDAAAPGERVVVDGREIYAWHPETIARSRLWTLLAGKDLGATATARNWTTVRKLLELADARAPS